jgi:PIN domain nuclease of toxin-antitoxin system
MLFLLNLQVLAWRLLGDRACITEGMSFANTRIATTDRAWKKIRSLAARVILIR